MALKRMPAIPEEAFTLLGVIPVHTPEVVVDNDGAEDPECYGISDFINRDIQVRSGDSKETQWSTFGHEVMHFVLMDGNADDSLTHDQAEKVCNAFGTYVAAAVKAGYLKFTKPRKGKE